jgi:hypothetical protein
LNFHQVHEQANERELKTQTSQYVKDNVTGYRRIGYLLHSNPVYQGSHFERDHNCPILASRCSLL